MRELWGAAVVPAHVARALPARTVELSDDVIAYDAATAARVSTEYLDPVHWVDLDVDARWIVIGVSGRGDEWLVGPDGGVSFFDHGLGERAPDRFARLHVTVTEWLMVGHLLGRHASIADPTADDDARRDAALDAISPELSDRWPYPID